jgi:type IV pilus assembly protein PilM
MATILEKIFGAKSGRSVLGIDISSSAIKLVQIRKSRGRAVLETYGELSLGPYMGIERGRATNLPAEKIAEALKNLLVESKTTTRDCGASIPLSSSLISILELPTSDENELRAMVPIEIRKYLPVNISEVALDWWAIPKDDERRFEKDKGSLDGKTEVLTVSVHKDTISKYQQILNLASLTPTFFEVEVFSSIRSSLEASLNPSLLIDLGAATTKIYIVERGVIRDSHIINRGSQDITQSIASAMAVDLERAEGLKRGEVSGVAEPQRVLEVQNLILEDIFGEANRVILNYQKKHNKSMGKIVFSGGGAILPNLPEILKRSFEIEAIVADPFSKLEAPAFLRQVLKTAGPEFAVAIGVALRKLEETE